MKITRTDEDTFKIHSGDETLTLARETYEDLFYSLPIDPSSLYMLLNETLLETGEQRHALQAIVEREGGIDKCMNRLSVVVNDTNPEEKVIGNEDPSEGDVQIIEKEERDSMGGESDFHVTRNPDGTYDLCYGSTALRLPRRLMRELYHNLPDTAPDLYRTILSDTLNSERTRSVFREMLSDAGGIANSLSDFEEQLDPFRNDLT